MATSAEKIAVLETEFKNINTDITEIKSDIKTMSNSVVAKLDAMEENSKKAHQDLSNRLTKIEQWRWMVLGAGIAVGYLVSHATIFTKIFG